MPFLLSVLHLLKPRNYAWRKPELLSLAGNMDDIAGKTEVMNEAAAKTKPKPRQSAKPIDAPVANQFLMSLPIYPRTELLGFSISPTCRTCPQFAKLGLCLLLV